MTDLECLTRQLAGQTSHKKALWQSSQKLAGLACLFCYNKKVQFLGKWKDPLQTESKMNKPQAKGKILL